jgi:hypothetical protein
MTKKQDEVPEGLHAMQYACHILEEILGWPLKGNQEMMADCIKAIGKSRRLTDKKAYLYLVRAIQLAKEQGIPVNHFFFSNGEYTEVRPEPKNTGIPYFKRETPEERAALEAHKQTAEYKQALANLAAALERLAGKVKMA